MKKGDWVFDEERAKDFSRIAHMNIPHYEYVIEICIREAKVLPKTAKIIDVGSATGNTLRRLIDAGYENVWGVDSSEAMLKYSVVQKNLVFSETFPKHLAPLDLVFANWTLHFVKKRREYLQDIRDGLKKGGVLIISEKISSTKEVEDAYHDFKRRQGMSEKEVEEKAAAIEGVLTPLPLDWYMEALTELGFEIKVTDRIYNFVTLKCTRK